MRRLIQFRLRQRTLVEGGTRSRWRPLQTPGCRHAPIVDHVTWDHSATFLRERRPRFSVRASGSETSPLMGKLFDEKGECLTPSHTAKGERRYLVLRFAQPDERS